MSAHDPVVLVCEPDDTARTSLELAIQSLGWQVAGFRTLAQVGEWIRQHARPPAAVILGEGLLPGERLHALGELVAGGRTVFWSTGRESLTVVAIAEASHAGLAGLMHGPPWSAKEIALLLGRLQVSPGGQERRAEQRAGKASERRVAEDIPLPDPAGFFPGRSEASRQFLREAWAQRSTGVIRIRAHPGAETDLLARELAAWLEVSVGRVQLGTFEEAAADTLDLVLWPANLPPPPAPRGDRHPRSGWRLLVLPATVDDPDIPELPPISRRPSDLARLVLHLWPLLAGAGARPLLASWSLEARIALLRRPWKGEYAELVAVLRHVADRNQARVTPADLPPSHG